MEFVAVSSWLFKMADFPSDLVSSARGLKAADLVGKDEINYASQSQIMAMWGAFALCHDELLAEADRIGNLQFSGTPSAAAAAAAAELNSVAGLSTLLSNHYEVAAQASNYGLAVHANDCASAETTI